MLSLFQLYSRRSLLHFWFRLSFLFSPRKTISKIPLFLSSSSSSMIKQTKRKQDWNKRKWRAPMGEQSKRWAWVNWSRLSRFDSAGELHRVPDDEINSIAKSAVCRKSGGKSTEGIRDTETMMMSIVGLPLGKWKHRRHSCLSLSLSLSLSLCVVNFMVIRSPGATLRPSVFLAWGKMLVGLNALEQSNVTIENRTTIFFVLDFSSVLWRFRDVGRDWSEFNTVEDFEIGFE